MSKKAIFGWVGGIVLLWIVMAYPLQVVLQAVLHVLAANGVKGLE